MSEQILSEARLAANRENAQKSCGPVTDEGKAAVRLNALKSGLTGATVVLPAEDAEEYYTHTESYRTLYKPVGPEESALVQSIADIRWRLKRIPGLEQTMITMTSVTLVKNHPNLAGPTQKPYLELFARKENDRDLRNLNLQENRLARRRERELAELTKLQELRKAQEEEKLKEAAKADLLAQHLRSPLKKVPGVGFDFTKLRYETWCSRLTAAQKTELLNQALAEVVEPPQTMPAAA